MVSFQEPLAAVHLLKELLGYIREKASQDPRLMELVNGVYASVIELREENLNLREKCDELMQRMSIKSKIVFDDKNHVYYCEEEKGKDGPFCQRCYDDVGKMSRLKREHYGHRCSVCKEFFYDETGRDRESEAARRMQMAVIRGL